MMIEEESMMEIDECFIPLMIRQLDQKLELFVLTKNWKKITKE